MSKRVLIEHSEGKTEIALMDEKRLLYFADGDASGPQAEEIYLGTVDRIVRGVEAAFVKLGKDQTGFLPFSECREKPRSGDRILVQVKKPPVGDKAPYLTADIALAGRYVLLTPLNGRITVSKKITDEEARHRLIALGGRIAPQGMGLVLRTESEDAAETDIAADARALAALWESVLKKREKALEPCLLQGREDALARLLRNEHGSIEEILTDAPEALPPLSPPVRRCGHPFQLYAVRSRLEKSMQRKVWLDCGGFLILDFTEAMTVIDVNSGKFTGCKTGTESTFLKLNLEAAREIARLLRLRNIGGIVIIDFVDMQGDESRAAVLSALEEALRDDPVKAVVHGFTSLGLVEMTRKKS